MSRDLKEMKEQPCRYGGEKHVTGGGQSRRKGPVAGTGTAEEFKEARDEGVQGVGRDAGGYGWVWRAEQQITWALWV